MLFLLKRETMYAALSAVAAAVIFYPLIVWGVVPRVQDIWMSPHAAALVAKDKLPGDPPVVLGGYVEPSLVFLLGTDTEIQNGKNAAEVSARTGGLALIEGQTAQAVRDPACASSVGAARPVDEMRASTTSRGMREHITRLPGDQGAMSRYYRTALIIVAAITLVRLIVIVVSPLQLYPDEAQYWWWAQTPDWGYFSKPPMIAWIVWLTTTLFGDQEWAIRLAAPLLHGATALLVYAIAQRTFDARTGFWSAIAYVTLPGISYSSGLISTDVPLLFFWALALYAFLRQRQNRKQGPAGAGRSSAAWRWAWASRPNTRWPTSS